MVIPELGYWTYSELVMIHCQGCLTWSALTHDQKEVAATKYVRTNHQKLNGPDMPTFHCYTKIENAERDLQ